MPDFEVEVEDISTAGDGVARLGAVSILIPYTLPGERVRVELPARPRPGTVARLRAILRPSPHRVVPKCRHFGPDASPGVGPCGGCAWQHIAYGEQLRLKTSLVDKLISTAVRGAPRARPTLTADAAEPWGYRQKVHFVFAGGGARASLAMGHYVRGSRRVIPVEECPVHNPHGNDLAFELRNRCARQRVEAAGERGHGALSSIAIRCGLNTSELMATVVVTHDRDKRLRHATRDTIAANRTASFHLNLHSARSAFIFGRETRRLHGSDRLREEVAGTSYLISPTAFFQTNVAAADLLVRLVIDAVGTVSSLLDLYAGNGLFALPLARSGIAVTAVEENRDAVAAGIASARLNKLDARRCQFVNRRVEDAVAMLSSADAVVLDPPREGCSPAVLDGVFRRLRPQRAVYVSCNPEALASELGAIAGMGYTIRSIQPVDMFPHTAHIETVVVLSR